jgi:hypothetical protein
MNGLRFTEAAPASDVGEVVAYLQGLHCDQFVYRGQTRSWPGPLFPSAFRLYKKTGQVFHRDETLPFASLRHAGNHFHEFEPLNHLWEFADRYCQSCQLSLLELNEIERLMDDSLFSLAICSAKTSSCIREFVTQEIDRMFSANYPAWKSIIDLTHRNRIRQFVCLNPFGYILGMAIAQHYGFSSEALDVTHDPLVAAFFATHEYPHYVRTNDSGIGKIIRFRITDKEYVEDGWHDKDFYSAGSYVDMLKILSSYEDQLDTHDTTIANLSDHVFTTLERGLEGRRHHRIHIGVCPISQTRVARQKSALLIPDILLKEAQMAGINIRQFIAIEDLSERSETVSFFFRHSPNIWPFPNITREYLWPTQDVFVDMFQNILSSSSPTFIHPNGMSLPKRIDLLDHGYEN